MQLIVRVIGMYKALYKVQSGEQTVLPAVFKVLLKLRDLIIKDDIKMDDRR